MAPFRYTFYQQNQDHPELNDSTTWVLEEKDGKFILTGVNPNIGGEKATLEIDFWHGGFESLAKKIESALKKAEKDDPWPSGWLAEGQYQDWEPIKDAILSM